MFDMKFAGGVTPSARERHDSENQFMPAPHPAETRRQPARPRPARSVVVELANDARLAEIRPAWIELLGAADEPNVFMDPALVRAAADAYPGSGCVALLAWTTENGHRRLTGLWAFSAGFARQSVIPVRVLTAPACLHGYAAMPVIDRSCADETLHAMLDTIAADFSLPKIIALEAMATNGPVMAALTRVLKQRGSFPRILESARRPKLESDLDGKTYLDTALSSSSRKKLRQHRRRFSERGELSSLIASDPQAVRAALEQFLRIEAAGWKGRQGTALLCSDTDAAFARAAVGALADHGCASIHMLCLDGRPVSMQIVLRSGAAAFTWKIAYDETLRDYSPGMLLLEDYTAAFLADPAIAFVNSCTYDDSSFMSVWTEREAIANLWIDARRGRSFTFDILWRLQKGYCGMRTMVKNVYLAPRRTQVRK